MLKKIIIWVVALAIIALLAAYLTRNTAVAWAIEKGSAYALGVKTHLGSANLSLGEGSLELNDYSIDNPDGFESKEFMSIKFGVMDMNYSSVFKDTVKVDSLVLDGIKVSLIQNGGKGNFMEIMNYARTINYDTSSSEMIVRINKVSVRNIAVDASLNLMNNVNVKKSFEVEDITLANVGGGDGATIGEVASIVLQEILNKAVIKGKGQLSDKFGQSIKQLEKSALDKAGEETVGKIKDIGSSLLGDKKKK